jgi:hypothetical protein
MGEGGWGAPERGAETHVLYSARLGDNWLLKKLI